MGTMQLASLLFGLALFSHQGGGYSLAVTGDVNSPLSLSTAQLAEIGKTKVSLKEHDGSTSEYIGVPLIDVLAKAGATVGDKLRGKALATYVVVEAQDGYRVAFGLGELEPGISGRTVILAYEKAGHHLEDKVGPVRLVIADDKKQARCVRMVARIRVVKLAD